MAGSALTSEPAMSSGIEVVRPAASTARPTVIGRSDVFWTKERTTWRTLISTE